MIIYHFFPILFFKHLVYEICSPITVAYTYLHVVRLGCSSTEAPEPSAESAKEDIDKGKLKDHGQNQGKAEDEPDLGMGCTVSERELAPLRDSHVENRQHHR